jgi:hypothetical protein
VNNCSYCNAREFYRLPPGPAKRSRKPEKVAEEMEYLHRDRDCSVFMFQDDDFPVRHGGDHGWLTAFCSELRARRLHDRIIWKICCRPDELNEENLGLMRHHGLMQVFIGLEDGTDEGLARLNKRTTLSDNLRCIELLRATGTSFDYGFMLFQPDSTYDSLNTNLGFLKKMCSDGYTYFETRVERELKEQGRLKGRPGHYDYDFMTESLNECYASVVRFFAEWMWGSNGVTNIARWLRSYFIVHDSFGMNKPGTELLRDDFTRLQAESNIYIAGIIEELFYLYRSGNHNEAWRRTIEKMEKDVRARHETYRHELTLTLQRLKS